MNYEVKEKLNYRGEKHRVFQPNDIVRHFKGNLYRIIAIARNTETKELEVIYESLYQTPVGGCRDVWARPYVMFEDKVDTERYPDAMQEYRMEIVEIQDVMNRETGRGGG